MTVVEESGSDVTPTKSITVHVDGVPMSVPEGTLAIRAAEVLGIEIPRFCDHPLLDPVAACRACLVEVEGMPKPQPACAQVLTDGMHVKTQFASEEAKEAQAGVMEFLLLNHPLDCPVCDKGGECPLQNQAMSVGRPESRFTGTKRTFEKPINVSAQILLDRERCVSCARCTRFADQIAGDPRLELLERGASQQVGTADDEPFDSYFSGNTIQICPVGALTSATYRFRARPFDLVSTPSVCEHCASGCSLRTDVRRGQVTRRLAGEDAEVNEEWNCDKGRFAFPHLNSGRLEFPMIRENGELRVASWPEALEVAARGLKGRGPSSAVLVGGRSTMEDAYAYSRFARTGLGTDNIDFRARASSEEEREFLVEHVAGSGVRVDYRSVERAPAILLVGLEPEDESPILFLRIRKAALTGTKVFSVASMTSPGLRRMNGALLVARPGFEASTLDALPAEVLDALSASGAVIMVGERAASSPGVFSAVSRVARQVGAPVAWVPRRAGERGAVESGTIAGLLPGGHPLADAGARGAVAAAWSVTEKDLPRSGLAGDALLDAMGAGLIGAVLVGGVDPGDYPRDVLAALKSVPFVVSLENHHSSVTELADVVFPVAAVSEKGGSFVDWEGRGRSFEPVVRDSMIGADAHVLALVADRLGKPQPSSNEALRAELSAIGRWNGTRPTMKAVPSPALPTNNDSVVVAMHRLLLDAGTLQEGDPHLAATARQACVSMNSQTAQRCGVTASSGSLATVEGPRGSVTLPVELNEDMADLTAWIPMNSSGCRAYQDLGLGHGDAVVVSGASK